MKIDILAIAAHPDDVELSCSGTLMAHKAQGKAIGVVDLTRGELGTRGTPETRKEEAADALRIMDLDVRENLGMADGFFKNDRVIQLKIIQAIRKFQPDIVLANAIDDRHPDHAKGAKLVYDALFLSGLSKIETLDSDGKVQEKWRPRLLLNYLQDKWIKPDIIVDISDFWDRKMESILAYGTQFHNPNLDEPETYISSKQFIHLLEARAREMARPCGFEFGEGFTSNNKFLGVKNLFEVF